MCAFCTYLFNAFWNAQWERWVQIVSVFSGIATVTALVYAIKALRESRKATQLQIFESIFKDVRDLEKELYTSYSDADNEKQQQWLSLLFNTLEHVAFLFNSKKLATEEFLGFYKDVLLDSGKIFSEKMNRPTQADPKAFAEFKKLIAKLKQS